MWEPSSESYVVTVFVTGIPGDNYRDCVVESGNVMTLTHNVKFVCESCATSHPYLVPFFLYHPFMPPF